MKTGSNLLAADKTEAWKDLPQATQAKAATRLVSTVENSAYQMADTMKAGATEITVNVNIGKTPSQNLCLTLNVIKPTASLETLNCTAKQV